MLRSISLAVRRIQSYKKEKKFLKTFEEWKLEIPDKHFNFLSKKLLLVRLDDIGDYVVFRNFLDAYKTSEKWKQYEITLLGNIAWKDLFESFDKDKVDKVIWIDKKNYFENTVYRKNLWKQLNEQAFETVICPSRTRPLLIDDLCSLATLANKRISSKNTFRYSQWNKVSDALYEEQFQLTEECVHEFIFNKLFTEWCCNMHLKYVRRLLENTASITNNEYLFFFIGANSGSRRWPVVRWIELINLVSKEYNSKIFISGGKEDFDRAKEIVESVANAESIAGLYSLHETINTIANAKIVISNNTMAAHVAVACAKPVVIITSGDNYFRFTDYGFLKDENVITLHPKIFSKYLKKYSFSLNHYEAVTSDIGTITAKEVFNAFKRLKDKH